MFRTVLTEVALFKELLELRKLLLELERSTFFFVGEDVEVILLLEVSLDGVLSIVVGLL